MKTKPKIIGLSFHLSKGTDKIVITKPPTFGV